MPRHPRPRMHPSGYWCSDVGEWTEGPSGRARRKTIYFRDVPAGEKYRAQAQRALDAYLAAREAAVVDLSEPTVEVLRKLYLGWVKRNLSAATYDSSRKILIRFAEYAPGGRPFGERRASGLTASDLDGWISGQAEAGRKPTYLSRQAAAVQAMLNWAARPVPGRNPERLIAANPLKGYQAPTHTHAPERFAQPAEVARMLRFAWRRADRYPRGGIRHRNERRLVLLLRCLVGTGARPGEICGLQWSDITWEAGRTSAGHAFAKATLPPERWKAGRKTGRKRTIFFTPRLTRALKRAQGEPGSDPERVFVHDKGPWTSTVLTKRFGLIRDQMKAAGLAVAMTGPGRMVPYLLRHTFVSTGLMGGVSPSTIAELVGTSPTMVHRHYGHLLQDHLAEAHEQVRRNGRIKQKN